MGLITKEVEVKVNAYTIKYYESLGYKIPLRKASKSVFQHTGKEFCYDLNNTFIVKVDDLQKRSNVKVDVVCDCCKGIVYGLNYEHYCESIDMFGEYVCKKCKTKHYKESCLRTYGVDNPAKLKNVQEQMSQTSLHRYGVCHPMQSLKVKTKANETLCRNGTQKTSKQQLYLHCLYGGKLNYPISYYATDICFPEEKLIVEYDGGFHDGNVKTGRLTEEEHIQKEIIRNNIIKREGYKQIRIISDKDLLPSDQVLLQMLSESRQYFSDYQNHSWIEYNISTSTLRNAENRQGIPYDFGTLRKIK